MMYDELIEQLRIRASWLEFAIIKTPSKTEGNRDAILFRKAAYAINDLITALTASNEVIAKSKPKWIPVTERLPDVGKDVLCFCRANISLVLGWDGNHWHEGADRYYMSCFVTHWMLLPEAPESEGE